MFDCLTLKTAPHIQKAELKAEEKGEHAAAFYLARSVYSVRNAGETIAAIVAKTQQWKATDIYKNGRESASAAEKTGERGERPGRVLNVRTDETLNK